MTPYYKDDHCTIYHGDCREILPQLDKVDLVLTDPPYGIGTWSSTGGNSISKAEADDINRWDSTPDHALFSQILAKGAEQIIWGGNYFGDILGSCRAPIVWDKKIRGMHFADGEFAWTSFDWGTLRIFEYAMVGGETHGAKLHPTQKPVPVMNFCIFAAKQRQTILDPFMGSGSTLRAAKDLGLHAIGIEIEEKYCEIAVKRLRQEAFNFGEAA